MWIVQNMRVYRKDKDETHLQAVIRLTGATPAVADFLTFQKMFVISEADAAWNALDDNGLLETIETQVWQGDPLTSKGLAA